MYTSEHKIKTTLNMSIKVIRMYDWLLDLYVLDFYVEDHWSKLPLSWRESFQNLDPEDFGDILLGKPINQMVPLSFLAFINVIHNLSISRLQMDKVADEIKQNLCTDHPKLRNLFLKHVKLKKRHEISLMAEIVKDVSLESHCNTVIDFGSGLGHLVRMMSYKYSLNTVGIECQSQLTEQARKLDLELEYTAKKHISEDTMSKLLRPVHINMNLSSHEQLLELQLPDTMHHYGLVGLHPCGDLGPTLLRHFVNSDHVGFICVVGCCYMKLSCDGHSALYPMSDYMKKLDSKLSYESREIACHAIEVYCDRLKQGNYDDLKVHAYRAALERILVKHNPKLKHTQIRNVKHSNNMTFQRYCALALHNLNVPLPGDDDKSWLMAEMDLRLWRRVVVVYTLRLALAPLVETVILLDRVLYVLERGLSCEIYPVFDPKLSPRNHIIIGRR